MDRKETFDSHQDDEPSLFDYEKNQIRNNSEKTFKNSPLNRLFQRKYYLSLSCILISVLIFLFSISFGATLLVKLSNEISELKSNFLELQAEIDRSSGLNTVALAEHGYDIVHDSGTSIKNNEDKFMWLNMITSGDVSKLSTPRVKREVTSSQSQNTKPDKRGKRQGRNKKLKCRACKRKGKAMRGPPGRDGRNGREGSEGPMGPAGPQGLAGKSITGPRGVPGLPGKQGIQGLRGERGERGTPLTFDVIHIHGDGSSGVRSSENGLLTHWMEDWSTNSNYLLFPHNGTLQVLSGGIYFIYSQILAVNSGTSYTSHEMKVNGKTFLRCKRSARVSTCFTSGVRKLNKNDNVYIVMTYPQTQVDMLKDDSFFGLVKWSDDQRHTSDEL